MKGRPIIVCLLILLVVPLGACMKGSEEPSDGFSESSGGTTSSEVDLTSETVQEIIPLSFTNSRAGIQAKGKNADYLLVVSAANTIAGSYALQLADLAVPLLQLPRLEMEEGADEPDDSIFHQFLMESGVEMASSQEFDPVEPPSLSRLSAAISAGEQQTFKILSSMTSLSKFEKVTATLRVQTADLSFYVDEANAGHISDEEIQELAEKFQEIILPIDRSLFGTESDINDDRHISIVMSCVTNRMSSSNGIVTGFFFPGDLYATSSLNPASNEQEIFYTLVPDPKGECGVPITAEFALRNILPGVLAHEFQHMISFNRHVLLAKGKTEEPWLNEGLSHLAEDLTGFGLENYSRVKLFLNRPNTTPLIPTTSPTLAERGAIYSFLRYLYEQNGDGHVFLQKLLDGNATGVTNLISSFGGGDPDFDEFPEFLNRWSITLAVSNTKMISDPKFNYQSIITDPVTGNPKGLCLRCSTNDGRGTILNGPSMVEATNYPLTTNISATATQYFLIEDAPADLWLQSTGNPALTGSVLRLE